MNSYYDQDQTLIQSGSALAANKVIRQAYALVGISLIPTMIGVWLGFALNNLPIRIAMNSPILYFVGVLAVFYGLIALIEKNRTNSIGLALMFVFTFFMGFMLQPLLYYVFLLPNGFNLTVTALLGTVGIFLGLALIGNNTSKDYSFLGRYIGVLFFVMFIGIVLNYFFLQMPMFSLVISFAIIGFSSMVLVYRLNMAARGGETSYISLALDIYISLYNIFTSLLRILAIFSGND